MPRRSARLQQPATLVMIDLGDDNLVMVAAQLQFHSVLALASVCRALSNMLKAAGLQELVKLRKLNV